MDQASKNTTNMHEGPNERRSHPSIIYKKMATNKTDKKERKTTSIITLILTYQNSLGTDSKQLLEGLNRLYGVQRLVLSFSFKNKTCFLFQVFNRNHQPRLCYIIANIVFVDYNGHHFLCVFLIN